MKNRFKSYSFWTALAGAVVIFLNALGDLFGFSVDNDLVKGLIMAFAGILVVLGIVTMPKDSEKEQTGDNQEEQTDESEEKNENTIDETDNKIDEKLDDN